MYPHNPRKRRLRIWKKDLRPISLTACLKVAEDCVVHDYIKPAVIKVLDPNQYGAVPHSSTTQALIHMVHSWAQATDGNSATIRTVLFDYRKAFDLIDHRILVDNLYKLVLPTRKINWMIDFLSRRSQRIKLAEGCYSKWGSVPSGVPQGSKLGPWLFLILINDLSLQSWSDYAKINFARHVHDTDTHRPRPRSVLILLVSCLNLEKWIFKYYVRSGFVSSLFFASLLNIA